ncbi:MAG: hypothetical protein HYV97_14800 [Bdellovibrio sp.]|nr:hypothetical protein [Bdellovibrio sp.]
MKNRKSRFINVIDSKDYREQIANFENEGNFPAKNIRYEKRCEKRRRDTKRNGYKK